MNKLNNKGVTLVELIVSFAIVGVAIIYFFQTLSTVKKIYSDARNETNFYVKKDYDFRLINAYLDSKADPFKNMAGSYECKDVPGNLSCTNFEVSSKDDFLMYSKIIVNYKNNRSISFHYFNENANINSGALNFGKKVVVNGNELGYVIGETDDKLTVIASNVIEGSETGFYDGQSNQKSVYWGNSNKCETSPIQTDNKVFGSKYPATVYGKRVLEYLRSDEHRCIGTSTLCIKEDYEESRIKPHEYLENYKNTLANKYNIGSNIDDVTILDFEMLNNINKTVNFASFKLNIPNLNTSNISCDWDNEICNKALDILYEGSNNYWTAIAKDCGYLYYVDTSKREFASEIANYNHFLHKKDYAVRPVIILNKDGLTYELQ